MSEEWFGPYRLEALIAEHGTGRRYRAHDTVRERTVALNLFSEAHSGDSAFRERFNRVCQLVAGLTEPHIVPIHDYGEIDGRLFVDMRFVVGPNLATVLADNGPLAPARAVDMIVQVAGALDTAHAAGLVHGDIRPRNLLLGDTDQGFVHIIDFSLVDLNVGAIATSAGGAATPATGTVAYTAPERFISRDCDLAVDIYALACLLYEMLTGKPPYQGDDLAVMLAHAVQEPPKPSQARAELPSGFDDVVARGLAKDPAERYPSAGALAEAALAVLDSGKPTPAVANTVDRPEPEKRLRPAPPTPVRSPSPSPPETPAPAEAPPTAVRVPVQPRTVVPSSAPADPPPPRSLRRRQQWMLAAGAAAVLALGTTGVLLLNRDQPPPEVKGGTPDEVKVTAVVSQITVGSRPEGLAVSQDGNRVYVANAASDTVSVIDSRGQQVVATIPVGHDPRDVAVTPDGNRVYITDFGSNTVSVIAADRDRVIATLPTGKGPKSVAISPDGQRAYVTNLYSDSLSVISTASETLLATIPAGDGPSSIALSADGLRAFVTDVVTGTVSTIDTRSNTIASSAPADVEPERIAVTPDGRRCYVTIYLRNTVRVIDNASNAPIATISVGSSPLGLSITPDGRRVYVANIGSEYLSIVDTSTNTFVGNVPIPAVKGAADVVIAADGRRAYVTSRESNRVSVIDIGN